MLIRPPPSFLKKIRNTQYNAYIYIYFFALTLTLTLTCIYKCPAFCVAFFGFPFAFLFYVMRVKHNSKLQNYIDALMWINNILAHKSHTVHAGQGAAMPFL